MRTANYILIGQTPVPEPDLVKWAEWFGAAGGDRIVAQTHIGATLISTVFLGIDHGFGKSPPLLFETMTFCDGEDMDCWRCSTWAEAEAQHWRIVAEWRARNLSPRTRRERP